MNDLMNWEITTQLPVSYQIMEKVNMFEGDEDWFILPGERVAERRHHLVIVDEKVYELYGTKIRNYFERKKFFLNVMTMPSTEEQKNIDMVLRAASHMNEIGIGRKGAPVIGIGGGVVLDMVGFAASLYRRGIPWIRVPTTLLAQVDVSVAAKTAVNFDGFRNRLGSYHPPARTIIDKAFLGTVPKRHMHNGMGEILKMALIKDATLFTLLESHGQNALSNSFQGAIAIEIIQRAITDMVAELEHNLWEDQLPRAVDFGHSFSPLIEMQTLPELLHGEAVTLDCLLSCYIAQARGLLNTNDLSRAVQVAKRLGLPIRHPSFENPHLLWKALTDTIRHRHGYQHLPVPAGLGNAHFIEDLNYTEIEFAAREMAAFGDASR